MGNWIFSGKTIESLLYSVKVIRYNSFWKGMGIFMDKNKILPELENLKEKKTKEEKEKKEEGKEEIKEIKEKVKEYHKNKTSWFKIGSFQRTYMILLSYILGLLFLCTSFFGASYLYWFGGETANNYWETQRFQKKLFSQLKKATPAVKQYLLQDIQGDNEIVEIYTLETEQKNEGVINRWKKTASYTCESGAEIVGVSTNFSDTESDIQATYKKKMDNFVYDNTNFNTVEEHFITLWESIYKNRANNGTQKYCAVTSDTIKEWFLQNSWHIDYSENIMELHVPDDAYYIDCEYHCGKGVSTILCYSQKKDRWYYVNLDEDDYQVDTMKFRMPDIVYFPLYSIAEDSQNKETEKKQKEETKKKQPLVMKEFSDGLSAANLYIQNGEMFSRLNLSAIEDAILWNSPFFNLKTILYEAGKEYYQQKSLLHYIDKKMEGYLWNFTFRSDSGNKIEIGSREGMDDTDNLSFKKWAFSVNFEEEAEKISQEPWLAALAMIGKQQGYESMVVELALPKSSLKAALFSRTGDTIERQIIRRSLENTVFSYGIICIVSAIVSFFCWLYLIIRLLFGKENIINIKIETIRVSDKNKRRLFSLERTPIEVWLIIFIGSIYFFYFLNDSYHISHYTRRIPILGLVLLFFDITFVYSLFYATIVSLIRLLRANILWKNFLVFRGLKWCKKKYQDFVKNIWCDFGYKRKAVLLAFGYIVGNIVSCSAGILLLRLFVSRYDMYGEYLKYLPFLLLGIFLFVFFLFLQERAIAYVFRNELGKDRIVKGIRKLSQGNLESGIDTKNLFGDYLEIAQLLPKIQDGLSKAIQKSIQDERMKTELITNVSHDIKTPLTSIINYIDLLKRSKPQGENVEHYLEVLTQKSQRLKQLIEDLVEASKASSGTLLLENKNLDLTELMQQAEGEFQEKLAQKNLQILVNFPQPPVTIFADGRRMFRILENLLQNVYKYAMEGTRVYFDLEVIDGKRAMMTLRNISAAPLNITEEELTERFVRGEESRTTEGSGLGLSIAKDLVKLQGGEFSLSIDGDLFKVVLIFPIVETEMEGFY